MNDFQKKLLEWVEALTPEEMDAAITTWQHSMYGGEEGYHWAMAREAERAVENAPDEVPSEMLALQNRRVEAEAALAIAQAELEDAREALTQYGESRVGLKRQQKLKVRVRKDQEEGGYIDSFKFLDNGVVLFGFVYGWGGHDYFNLSDIVEVWEGEFAPEGP